MEKLNNEIYSFICFPKVFNEKQSTYSALNLLIFPEITLLKLENFSFPLNFNSHLFQFFATKLKCNSQIVDNNDTVVC